MVDEIFEEFYDEPSNPLTAFPGYDRQGLKLRVLEAIDWVEIPGRRTPGASGRRHYPHACPAPCLKTQNTPPDRIWFWLIWFVKPRMAATLCPDGIVSLRMRYFFKIALLYTLMSTSQKPGQTTPIPDSAPVLPTGILNSIDATLQEPIPWVIDKLLAEGEQMLIFGPPKVGKSQFALQLAMSVALGKPFLNWQIKEPKRVLYMNFEMGTRFFMLRVGRHYLNAQYPKDSWTELSTTSENSEIKQWLLADLDACPSQDLLEQINRGIDGKLYFTDGLREFDLSKQNSESEKVIAYWQSVVDVLKPELIVFDTLSKTHTAKESDNQEIKDVLLKLRKVASVSTSVIDATKTNAEKSDERKELAHVIIHHARKLPEHGKEDYISLDNIRGGSAIRAEADLIFGIFGAVSKNTKTDEKSSKLLNRTITIESRNLESGQMKAIFDGWVVLLKNSKEPAEKLSDQQWLVKIKQVFIDMGMRGISQKTLITRLMAAVGKGVQKGQCEEAVKRLSGQNLSDFQIISKAGNEALLANYPCERLGGKNILWIRDDSDWLKEPDWKKHFADHQPPAIRKRMSRA